MKNLKDNKMVMLKRFACTGMNSFEKGLGSVDGQEVKGECSRSPCWRLLYQ